MNNYYLDNEVIYRINYFMCKVSEIFQLFSVDLSKEVFKYTTRIGVSVCLAHTLLMSL